MEPVEKQVIIHYATVATVTHSPALVDWFFSIDGIPASFYAPGDPCLRPGDRVKITITKEPPDAKANT